jgi:hypothetical protein
VERVFSTPGVVVGTLLVAVAACAPPITVRRQPPSRAIGVRLAFTGEFERPRLLLHDFMFDCHVQGAPAPELREPVIAFARDHLLWMVGGGSRWPYSTDRPSSALPTQRGDYIVVDARTKLGQLELRHDWVWRPGFSGKSTTMNAVFCLHVEDGGAVVVIEPRGGTGENAE